MRAVTVQKRNAFTLIELLVVIAIIVILMALTVGVLSKVWQGVDETKTTTEISKLAESMNTFKGTFGRFPPSRILLCENWADYSALISAGGPMGQLAAFSVESLTSMFSGIGTTAVIQFDWNGNGTIDRPISGQPSGWILEGEECLVFFLGGMRFGASAPVGFNTDKSNPTANSNTTRLGPFYPFDESRIAYTSPNAANSGNMPIYKDHYGIPYAYFKGRDGTANNYPNRYFPYVAVNTPANIPNDCEMLTTFGGVPFLPYFVGTVPPSASVSQWTTSTSFQFHKPDTFQIISAGRDKQFGTGGQYIVQNPENSPFLPPGVVTGINPTADQVKANFDNITNFTGGRLVPQ